MDDLVTWLRAQLDEDERKVEAMQHEATRVQTAPIFQGHPPNWLAGVDIFVSPTRWQAEVDAKRQIIEHHEQDAEPFPCRTMRLLALPYSSREGYREEWRPVTRGTGS